MGILVATVLLALQWDKMRLSNSEANLLPDDHPLNLEYQNFLNLFGEEGNAIVIAVKDSALFELSNFERWNTLSKQLVAFPEVSFVISIDNLQALEKDPKGEEFVMTPFLKSPPSSQEEVDGLMKHLFEEMPFYKDLLFNAETGTIRTVAYLDKDIINTTVRKDFILQDLNTLVDNFEQETGLDVRVSGMPYIRTMNSQNILSEIGLFIGAALLVTSLIFFFFFRSFRATFISMIVVIIGVMWALGLLGLLQYEITVLTALIPPLIIVI